MLSNDTKETTFAITGTKHYVLVLTLATQVSAKLLEQLKSSVKRILNWNKHDPKACTSTNPILRFLN